MSFTTQTFLFVFFPICVICYYFAEAMEKEKHISLIIKKVRMKDIVLIIFSMGFYMWACFDDIFRFIIYITCIYIAGKKIEKRRNRKFLLLVEEDENVIVSQLERYKKISWALPVLVFSIIGVGVRI